MSVSQEMMVDEVNGGRESDTEDSEDDLPEIDLSSGNKDTSVLEVIWAYMQEESKAFSRTLRYWSSFSSIS